VSTLDILPTVAAACGVPTGTSLPLDGVDLLPYLRGESAGAPHDALFWKLSEYSAVRVGRWKVFLDTRRGVARLHDLETDPGEKQDVSAEHPGIFQDLLARYAQWDRSLPPRAWTNISPVFQLK
jgi:arylsulfatase A-like enzyme